MLSSNCWGGRGVLGEERDSRPGLASAWRGDAAAGGGTSHPRQQTGTAHVRPPAQCGSKSTSSSLCQQGVLHVSHRSSDPQAAVRPIGRLHAHHANWQTGNHIGSFHCVDLGPMHGWVGWAKAWQPGTPKGDESTAHQTAQHIEHTAQPRAAVKRTVITTWPPAPTTEPA